MHAETGCVNSALLVPFLNATGKILDIQKYYRKYFISCIYSNYVTVQFVQIFTQTYKNVYLFTYTDFFDRRNNIKLKYTSRVGCV